MGLNAMITLNGSHTYVAEIKKSRFIAKAVPIASNEVAKDRVAALEDPAATHNCYAFRVGDCYRFSDDGEPGGTAGRPILSAIDGQALDNVLVMVTRFFGGIKLGSGGLVRAYGGTAAKCLHEAPKRVEEPTATVVVRAPFDTIGAIYPILAQFAQGNIDPTYRASGPVLNLTIEKTKFKALEEALSNATRGSAHITLVS
ncbi:MAG: YigZ family protein [Myxococcota bacterium]|nr:YigZ family protein [Myxococcota bacterium]